MTRSALSSTYAKFRAGRERTVGVEIDQLAGSTWSGYTLPANLTPHVRGYQTPPGSAGSGEYEVDVTLLDVSSGARTRFAAGVTFPTGALDVVCELVLVDADVVDAATPSGQREIDVDEWPARVDSALSA